MYNCFFFDCQCRARSFVYSAMAINWMVCVSFSYLMIASHTFSHCFVRTFFLSATASNCSYGWWRDSEKKRWHLWVNSRKKTLCLCTQSLTFSLNYLWWICSSISLCWACNSINLRNLCDSLIAVRLSSTWTKMASSDQFGKKASFSKKNSRKFANNTQWELKQKKQT